MAVSDILITSLVEAVAALNSRVNEAADLKLIPGPKGDKGDPGERGEQGPAPSEAEIKAAAAEWLAANITQPKDGEQGPQGDPGPQGERGPGPTEEEIRLAVDLWFEINSAQLRGTDGRDGRDGVDGRDGDRGDRGPRGDTGPAGAEGIGIALIEQRDEGSFWITLTDGREFEIELPQGRGTGGSFFYSPPQPQLGSFYSLEDQTDGVNNATPMRYEITDISVGVHIQDLTKITIAETGTYNIQFSAQLVNSDSQAHEISIWLAKNGANVVASCTDITVPSKHGSFNGHAVAAWNFFADANAGDYFELYWSSPSSLVFIEHKHERTTPSRPSTPSVILTVSRVNPI